MYRCFTNIFIALFFSVFRPLCSGSSITAVVNESGMVPSKWSNIIENWKLIADIVLGLGIGIEKPEIHWEEAAELLDGGGGELNWN